jgi:hypothetical protein
VKSVRKAKTLDRVEFANEGIEVTKEALLKYEEVYERKEGEEGER